MGESFDRIEGVIGYVALFKSFDVGRAAVKGILVPGLGCVWGSGGRRGCVKCEALVACEGESFEMA